MFICLDCGHVAENLTEWIEPHGEPCMGCHRCGGACVEAVQCANCDKWIPADGDEICDDCIADIRDRLTWLLRNEFTQAERDYIESWLDPTPLKG